MAHTTTALILITAFMQLSNSVRMRKKKEQLRRKRCEHLRKLVCLCCQMSVCCLSTFYHCGCFVIEKYTKSKEGSKFDPLVNKQPAKVEETKVKEVVVDGEEKSLKLKDKLAKMAKRGDRPGSKQNKTKQKQKEPA
jgi:hypothetical protein